MTRLGRWAALAGVLALMAAAAGCGGGGGGKGGAASPRTTLAFDTDVRCADDPRSVGCLDGAPAGTRFTVDHNGQRWTVDYVGAKVERSATGEPDNPQRLMVITTLRYALLSSARGPVQIDDEGPFQVSAAADRIGSLKECGQRPQTPTVQVGQSVTVQNCFSASGPPSLLAAPLAATVLSDPLDGQAHLEVKDVPATQ
jgi:hypothetical protein